MKFGRRRRAVRAGTVVELTPLIDVVFLLLIFFVLSTTFREDSVLALELPTAVGAPKAVLDREIAVRIAADGAVAIDEVLLEDGAVDTVSAALAAADGDRVLVSADAAARHDAVVRVLDAVQRSGLTEVRIAGRRPQVAGDDGGS